MTKLIAGLGLLLVSTGVPFVLYLIWACVGGIHSSPFEWQMAAPTFIGWASSAAVFLTAFLIGIREARWYGSRLWPAAPVVVLYLYFGQFQTNAIPAMGAIVLLTAALLGRNTVRGQQRDD